MSFSALALFAAVFALASASPGPTTMALVARVLGRGAAGVPLFCLGLLLGDLAWLACAALGVAALAAQVQPLLVAIKYAGAAYLLVLAWKCWSAPVDTALADAPIAGEGRRLLLTGLTLALGNPKTMLFYIALLPGILPLGALDGAGLAALLLTVALVYSAVLAAYVVAAAHARRLLRSPRRWRAVNRGSGLLMAGAAATIAAR